MLGLLIWRFPYILGDGDNLGSVMRVVLLLCLVFPAVHHFGLKQSLKHGTVWLGVFMVLLVGYSYQEELSHVAVKLKGNLLPFSATQNKDGSVSFTRSENGHFQVEAYVNQVPIRFMVDTGASTIVLSPSDAKRLDIDVENLSYARPISTVNGLTFAASAYLAELKIGPIVTYNVSALVSKNLSGFSLLGMNFLQRLKGFRFEGDRLTFEAPSSILK